MPKISLSYFTTIKNIQKFRRKHDYYNGALTNITDEVFFDMYFDKTYKVWKSYTINNDKTRIVIEL